MVEKQSGADSPPAGAVLNNLAEVYSAQGRYADAEPVMLRAIAIYESSSALLTKLLGDTYPAGPMLGNLAEIYEAQGRYSEAEALFKRALTLAEKDRDKTHLALALNNLAELYGRQGRFSEAEPLLKRSLDTAETLQGGSHPYTATLLGNLASLYGELGRRPEAEALLKRSLAMREEALGPDHPDVTLSLSNLAVHFFEEQRHAEAEPLLKRAQAIREKTLPAGHPDIARGLNNLAELYRAQHRFDEAAPLYERALAIREKTMGPNHRDTAESLHNLAGFYQEMGRYEDAAQAYKRSLAIFENALGADHPLVATSLNNTAELHFKQQDWAQAASYWRRSTGILIRRFKRGVQDSGAGHPGSNTPETGQESSRFRRLVRVSYRVAAARPAEAPEIAARMFEAAQWAQDSAAAQSLAKMAARGAKGEGPLGRLVREQQDLAAEWQANDKLLTAARSQPADMRDGRVEDELHARLADIAARLADIGKALAKDFPDYAAFASPEPLSLAEAQSLLEDNEALVLFLDMPEKAPLPEETFVWFVTKTTSRWVRVLLGTPSLKREVQALRCGLDFENSWGEGSVCRDLTGQDYTEADHRAGKPLPFDASRAHALYRALFGEGEDTIEGKRLLIATSGPLSQLPFQVLVTEAPGAGTGMAALPWLVRKHSLAVLPAVSSLKALRRDSKSSRSGKAYFGIGNPLLNGMDAGDAELAQQARGKRTCPKQPEPASRGRLDLRRSVRQVYMQGGHVDLDLLRIQPPLPETADELCAVAGSLQAQDGSVLLGAEATEASLKALSDRGELASYGILHFATHGALAGQIGMGSEPGLILTPPQTPSELDDGYLSASEIVSLKLDAGWVILSACNTAAGGKDNSEALSGLARSFFYAGARSMLVSHWAVNSAATVKLVTGAIAAMTANPSAGRAEALRQAMLALIDRGGPEEAHPAYWAPFVVAGEGGMAK
jgi:CHAT domain-containing protein/tetratricopeptide (TPR) repeat protein